MTMNQLDINTPTDGSVTSAKLSGDLVTPGALDVTGTVTADGLTVQTTNGLNALLESTTSYQYLQFKNSAETNNFIGFVSDDFVVSPANNQKLIVTAEGNVGIGTSPSTTLEIANTGNGTAGPILRLTNPDVTMSSNQGIGAIEFFNSDATGLGARVATNIQSFAANTSGGGYLTFGVSPNAGTVSEAMRIDASGNFLVGKTSLNTNTAGLQLESDGYLSACRDGGNVVLVNRKSSDGALVTLQKDGTTVGSIGSVAGAYLSISGTTGGRLQINGTDEYAWDTTQFYPANDNANDLGFITKRWDDIYATNGTIQTSDRNEKQDIEALSDAEQRVAVAAKGLLRKFRWISSVEENGDDARIHFGIIAQDLQDAFTAEGLDAGRYAMFISSTWTDEETGEERTRLGVRYSELLAFIISAI